MNDQTNPFKKGDRVMRSPQYPAIIKHRHRFRHGTVVWNPKSDCVRVHWDGCKTEGDMIHHTFLIKVEGKLTE